MGAVADLWPIVRQMRERNDAHARALGLSGAQAALVSARADLERAARSVAEATTGHGTSARRHYSEHVTALAHAAVRFAAAERAVRDHRSRDQQVAVQVARVTGAPVAGSVR